MAPMRPGHPCSQPGCRALVSQGSRCPKHAYHKTDATIAKPYSKATRTADTLPGPSQYGSARWKKARRTHLDHSPFCVLCGDFATTVDHDPPFTDSASFWDTSKWRSLCAACHNTVTAKMTQTRRRTRATLATLPALPQE